MVSIIIPAKNEEKNISACLNAVFAQEISYAFEVIVIDSGSTDHTVHLVKEFPTIRLLEIPAESFGHGKTRNLGAATATGEFLVFLNADALPANSLWLSELIKPLQQEEKRAGIFSQHLPKKGCFLYMQRDLSQCMPPTPSIRTQSQNLDFMIFSTVSCAIRRSVWEQLPFDNDILIAEDQQWAKTVLKNGYSILYEPASRVYHSHNYTPAQLFHIKRQVGISTCSFKNRYSALTIGFVLLLGGICYKLMGDIIFIFFKAQVPFIQKLKEFKTAISARVVGFYGRYVGWLHSFSTPLKGKTHE